jgi:retinitis pigmentosa 9 protein
MAIVFREGEAVDDAEVEALRRPEDEIPDLPENQAARSFLKSAPSKGLWMPLGKEVKVMQCFRCKAFGHRTGDRECPLAISGNTVLDAERQVCNSNLVGV